MIRRPAARMRRTDTGTRKIVALRCQARTADDIGRCRTFEPLLAGDRQKQKRVAKARNPLQRSAFEVSLS
jgi:hypothetical protein